MHLRLGIDSLKELINKGLTVRHLRFQQQPIYKIKTGEPNDSPVFLYCLLRVEFAHFDTVQPHTVMSLRKTAQM